MDSSHATLACYKALIKKNPKVDSRPSILYVQPFDQLSLYLARPALGKNRVR